MAARKIRRTCLSAQTKFSVQPFSKGWQIPKAAPLVAFRRKRNPPMLPKDQEGMGNPIKGFPKRQGRFGKGKWAGKRGFLSLVFRLAARRGEWVGGGRRFCRTASCGEPLDRVPLGRTAHRAGRPSLPDPVGSLGDFALCGGRLGGAAPKTPASLLGKGWIENLVCARCGWFLRGTMIVTKKYYTIFFRGGEGKNTGFPGGILAVFPERGFGY